MKLKNKFRGSPFITFNNLQELARILQEAQTVKEEAKEDVNSYDEIYSWADRDPNPLRNVHPRNSDDDMGFGNFI